MRYHHYFVKRFLIPRVDVSIDEYFRGDCDLDGTPIHPEFDE